MLVKAGAVDLVKLHSPLAVTVAAGRCRAYETGQSEKWRRRYGAGRRRKDGRILFDLGWDGSASGQRGGGAGKNWHFDCSKLRIGLNEVTQDCLLPIFEDDEVIDLA
ncbi:hypothetical protein BC830DRAFT_1076862 [Chytriomyces sp. MP71]|nr:hypothetical protein BC830DRAFT_1076993 [Chytriomyces sp. MP71]KAI8621783.1 hypothetical protein BC830DRAFT_1076862 [Chytriomyces sp. MP71]